MFKNDFITFTGKKPGVSKKDFIDDNITPYGRELMDNSLELAKKYNHAEVNNYHVLRASLEIIKKYIEELNDNKRTFSENVPFEIWSVITDMTLPDVFKTKPQRDTLLKVINEQIKIFDETLKELPKNKSNNTPVFSKDLINDIYSTYLIDKTDDEDEKTYSDERISDATIFNAALYPYTEKYNKLILPLKESLKSAFLIEYSHLVGTGDCLIDGDIFREEFANWKSKQSNTKLQELETLDNMILDAIKATKNGKIY